METPTIAVYIILGGIGLIAIVVIIYYFSRWVFSIERQLWNQKQQINLLIKIAERLGVNSEDIDIINIKNKNNEHKG